jgi:type II secretory pathway pseudopilin PulG
LGQTSKAHKSAALQNLAVAYQNVKAYAVDGQNATGGTGTGWNTQNTFSGYVVATLNTQEPQLSGTVTISVAATADSITFQNTSTPGNGGNCTEQFLASTGPVTSSITCS